VWNTKYESLRNEIDRENAIQEIAQKLNVVEITVKEVKLEIKTIRTGNAAELAKVVKSEKSGADLHDIYVSK
jgi:DNA-directed RNA polymerase specialized sigma subunit